MQTLSFLTFYILPFFMFCKVRKLPTIVVIIDIIYYILSHFTNETSIKLYDFFAYVNLNLCEEVFTVNIHNSTV